MRGKVKIGSSTRTYTRHTRLEKAEGKLDNPKVGHSAFRLELPPLFLHA